MKKIVHISNIPSPYQIEWAKELRTKYDIEFWFMTDMENSITGRPNYWNVKMPYYCKNLPSKFQKGEFCYGPTLTEELNKFNPDIVMLQGAWFMIAWFQAYRWAVKNNKKILIGPCEFSEDLYSPLKIIRNRLIYNIIYPKINMFLANAYIHYDYLTKILKRKKVYLFMNYDNYKPYINHSIRKDKDILTFMYGGAISRRMRVPELLKVYEKIASRYINTRLIIGGYGPEKEKCRQIVEDSHILSNTVIFQDVDSWDEIPNVYKNCDILINYAKYSPGSGVILSAIASGMGVISNISVNSSRHFVIDKYNGFIISDESELYYAMEKYILNSKIVYNHSIRSKEIGKTNLTFTEHLNDFTQIIDNYLTK